MWFYPCSIFVTVSKCRKSPKLTNIVILEKVTILCDDNVCHILVISVGRDVLAVKAPNFAAFLQLWRSTCWPGAHAPSRPRPSNNSPSSPNAATPSTSPKVLTSLLPPSLPCSQSTKWMFTSACKSPPLGIFGLFFLVKFSWRSIHPCAIFSLIFWALDCTRLVWPFGSPSLS